MGESYADSNGKYALKHFTDRMANAVRRCKTPVLVGLDPRQDCLPAGLLPEGNGDPQQLAARFETFCREVIDVVAPLVAAVKPQAAFFEQIGPDGMCTLAKTIQYASDKGLIVILDGKRNGGEHHLASEAGQRQRWRVSSLLVWERFPM